MATSTPYLQMHRPADDGSESMANPEQDFNANYDKIQAFGDRAANGWEFIDNGFSESGNFVIDITKGGEFPAGTFKMLQFHLSGSMLEDTNALGARINSDAATDLYKRRRIVFGTNGGVDHSEASSGEEFLGPRWDSGSENNTAELTIFKTDVLSNLPILWEGGRPESTIADRSFSLCSGALSSNRLIDSLQIVTASPGVGAGVKKLAWTVKGVRAIPVPLAPLHQYVATDTSGKLLNKNANWDEIDALANRSDLGWTFIGSGAETADFDLDLTVSGKYPVGSFRLIRVHFIGELTINTYLVCRVNDFSAASSHRRGGIVWNASDGTQKAAFEDNATFWRLADWSLIPGNSCVMTIYPDTFNSKLSGIDAPGMQSYGFRSSSSTAQTLSKCIGAFVNPDIDTRPSTLRIGSDGGNVDNLKWYAEGFRIP